jgi:hypothetical protein
VFSVGSDSSSRSDSDLSAPSGAPHALPHVFPLSRARARSNQVWPLPTASNRDKSIMI